MKSLLFTLALGLGLSAYAGTYVTPSTTAEPDTAACAQNTKFYKIYLKSKNYVDAYTFWKRVYDECPLSPRIFTSRVPRSTLGRSITPRLPRIRRRLTRG